MSSSRTDDSLSHASALTLARLVRERAVSSEELVRASLDRIAAYDKDGSIFVHVMRNAAIRDARRKDALLKRADTDEVASLPTFFGVPTAIKDLNFVRGAFTRLGSRAFKWVWSPVDDRTVANVRRGGFVIVGKLATSEIGALPVTEPDIHPPTRNPWNRDHTSGGSSGGTGAALAARLVPIAQGSDGAGSIRIPSSFCHLFGIKPSRGRIEPPYGPHDPMTLSTCGPMGHSVEDVAAFLDVMARTMNSPRTFRALAFDKPPPLRVRVTVTSPLVSATPAIADAVRRVARTLEGLGHHVDEGSQPEGSLEEFLPLWQLAVSRAPVLFKNKLQPVTRWLHDAGRKLDPQTVLETHRILETRLNAWFGDADLFITPTVAEPPPLVGAWKSLPPDEAFTTAARLGAFTALFNITGQPAATVPAAVGSNGLPIGVQIVGRRGEDDRVLAVCKQIEEAMPWSGRAAPGS
jgi:amidase